MNSSNRHIVAERGGGGASAGATSSRGSATRAGRAGSAPAVAECPRGRFTVVRVCEGVVEEAAAPGRSGAEPSRLEPDEEHPASPPDVPDDELAAAEVPELSRICASKRDLVRKRPNSEIALHHAHKQETPHPIRVCPTAFSPKKSTKESEESRSMSV